MKKLSEVSKITGLSRRALQGYDSMGLISPSDKTEAGYWLYDDEAIRKLVVIKIFTEAGYTREQMKNLLASPDLDIVAEYEKLIESLREEQLAIEGKIRAIRLFKIEGSLSDATRTALLKINPSKAYQDESFASSLDRIVQGMTRTGGEIDVVELESYTALWFSLVAIGLEAKERNAKDVRQSIKDAFESFSALIDSFEPGCMKNLDRNEAKALFAAFVKELFTDMEIAGALANICGYDAAEPIADEISRWAEKRSAQRRKR